MFGRCLVANIRLRRTARELESEAEVALALIGQVVDVQMQSPNGDYVLTYSDGHRVRFDCGYVGARIYEEQPPQEDNDE